MQLWIQALAVVLVVTMICMIYSLYGNSTSFKDVEEDYNHVKSYPKPIFHLLGDSITENRYSANIIIL